MCGPLQDPEGAIVERSQRRLGAIPADEHEPRQEELLWQCDRRRRGVVARGEWRPARHGGLKVSQEGRRRRLGGTHELAW